MACMMILFASLPPPDAPRLERAFLDAMRATGVDVNGRRFFLDGDADSYHSGIWGEDALDCHAYSVPLPPTGATVAPEHSASPLAAILQGRFCSFFVECSPL